MFYFLVDKSGIQNLDSLNNKKLTILNDYKSQLFNLFPNPSNGTFSINIPKLTKDEFFKIQVRNSFGQLIYENIIDDNNTNFDLKDKLVNGLYFVSIENLENSIFNVSTFLIEK